MFFENLIILFDRTAVRLSDFLWLCLFLPLFITASVILSCRTGALQLRHFGLAMRETIGRSFTQIRRHNSAISPLQAAATSLGSTVGTGNIIGTAQAICMGGPGVLFWLWLTAFLSMIIKYSELCLAIHYRKGSIGYGPMDYISRGLGSKKLASLYCFMALLSSLFMGNLTQASSIKEAFTDLSSFFVAGATTTEKTAALACGFILAGITLLLLSGGAKRITDWAGRLVPFMVLLFVFLSLWLIAVNIQKLPAVMRLILKEAFSPGSICGAAGGLSLSGCIQWGFRRSAFSNEAGLGTAAIAHGCAESDKAAIHGLWGIFEVFVDTVIICSCTGLCILCSGIHIPYGSMEAGGLYRSALASVFGQQFAAVMLALFIGLFAYTSIMGWALYGSRCSAWLFGERAETIYKILFVPCLILGCILPVSKVWIFSDIINAVMALPNLIAIILLRREIILLSRKTFS